jgi:ATP-dependent DNA helicase RecG
LPLPADRKEKKHSSINLDYPIQYIKGIGPKRAEGLASVEIKTVEDLLYYLPRKYLDRSLILPIEKVKPDIKVTVMGAVHAFGIRRGRKPSFQVILKDDTGYITLVWFGALRYIMNQFKENDVVIASGDVSFYRGLEIIHPEYEIVSENEDDLIHTGRVIPLYPSTSFLKKLHLDSRGFRKILKPLTDNIYVLIEETLPEQILEEQKLLSLAEALRNIHFPESMEKTEEAHKRLAFDELFYLELLMALRKKKNKVEEKGIEFKKPADMVKKFLALLPFELTLAQRKVLREITYDMISPKPMNRLLQGDVGSGKTIVALIAILIAVENDYQSALMVPTEILAEQHFLTIHKLIESLGIKIVLLTSSVKDKERKKILSQIHSGEAQIIVGTHSLIEEKVEFQKLGLAVIDEQHRFGVMQRAKLREKGFSPDVLVMTATPIPRTLALTVYGDLDVSTIDQLPPGRRQIKTSRWNESQRKQMYDFLDKELEQGRQAYIVYPLVEESEKQDLKAATESYKILKEKIFPHRKIALLHGRIKNEEREKIMLGFRNKECDILVCTTVIEVGLDVPNASVMVIEHSERFGLSQLHQLRGRIGRSSFQSYCFLMADYPRSPDAQKRLQAMCNISDGFKISEIDLKLRGPGEFFGTRQHGLPELKIADIIEDSALLFLARDYAFQIIEKDPTLSLKNHGVMKENFLRKYQEKYKLIEIG